MVKKNYCRKWIFIYLVCILLTASIIGGINALFSPYGVFGDQILNWHSYNTTNNPKAAKNAYLNKYQDQYDSYIIGSSKTSAFSTEKLNQYFGDAKFYNMIMYGEDIYDIEKTVEVLVEQDSVKNIVVNIGLEEAIEFNAKKDPIESKLDTTVESPSKRMFYSKYFLENTEYTYPKLVDFFSKKYLSNSKSVFNPNSDKDLGQTKIISKEQSSGAINRIKSLCEAKGIRFTLIASPNYINEVMVQQDRELMTNLSKLANMTKYRGYLGDAPVSMDPMYFYDPMQYRNPVDEMVLDFIYNDESKYLSPETKYASQIFDRTKLVIQDLENSYKVPILMYHHIDNDESKSSNATITPKKFKNDMAVLKKKGYQTIFFKDLYDYVYEGKELPQKPILVTFDDGYKSNYEYAYPILKELNMKATISIIGESVGKNRYKDTNIEIIPHFTFDEAKEMVESGIIDIQSHSFKMHDNQVLKMDAREGVLQRKEEKEKDYTAIFKNDYSKSKEEIENYIGNKVFVYTYPFGKSTILSEVLLNELNNKITVTTQTGINAIIKGLPQSLYRLKRINMPSDLDMAALIVQIENEIE